MTEITLTQESYRDIIVEGKTGRVFVKTITELKDGDRLVSQDVHRRPIEPDADLKGEDDEVTAYATLARTPEALARFEVLKDVEPVEAEPVATRR